jgi:hypothetical protein
MKNRLALIVPAIALLILPASSHGAAFVGVEQDAMDYAGGSTISASLNGGLGWNATGDPNSANTAGWGASTTGGSAQVNRGVNSPGLTYTAIGYGAASGNRATVNGSGIGRVFGQTVDAGSFYFSFITDRNVNSNRTLNVAFFNGATEQFAIGQIGSATADSGGNFAVFLNNGRLVSTTGTPIAYGLDVAHLVIGRVDFDAGGNERLRVYIDPTDVTDESFLTPYIDDSSTNFTGLTQFRMFAGTTSGALTQTSGDFDEFRFGGTFSSVVTTAPEPTVMALLTGSAVAALVWRRQRKQ